MTRTYCVASVPRTPWRRVLWKVKQRIRSAMIPRGDGQDFTGWAAEFLGPGDTLAVGTVAPIVSAKRDGRYLQHHIDLPDLDYYATLPSPQWVLTSPDGRTVRLRPWSWEGLKYRIGSW